LREFNCVNKVAKSMKANRNTIVVGNDGPPCHRCGCATEIREHKVIGPKELRRPFYYSRWYNCANRACRTNLIMPDQFRVFPESEVPQPSESERRLEAIQQQLTPPGEACRPWDER
jgi:hypothetical protein